MFLSLASCLDLTRDDTASDSSLNTSLPVIYEAREVQMSCTGVGRIIRVMPASADAADAEPNAPTAPSPQSVNKLSPRGPTLVGLGDSGNYELPEFLLPVRVGY